VQQTVGVERAAIFHDYCETNSHFGLVTPRMERMMKIFSFGRLQMENVRASLSARKYLQAAFDRIDQRHGGLAAYLAKCGVTSGEIETLRGLLSGVRTSAHSEVNGMNHSWEASNCWHNAYLCLPETLTRSGWAIFAQDEVKRTISPGLLNHLVNQGKMEIEEQRWRPTLSAV
jgi:hypothetical protein